MLSVTVEELMRGNFPHGWPNSDAAILQLESYEGAWINWKQLVAQCGEQDWGDNAVCQILSWWSVSVCLDLDVLDVL